ncbi:transporter substrate-binding domain-containing protein [Pseudodesulfovibrio sp. F-1]|uniref:Transporter substrate-binding domain-containing protein n=1 Tax=Pseudodesulfovibrio alkaliphilus TaxID=2661613 RepID=A0A7K1KR38_9BACT|nr:transporter substrate-binding domain-containing protein [Pseudodesulfovibrio alkaliphilus]
MAGVVLAAVAVLAAAPGTLAGDKAVLRVSFNSLPPWKVLNPDDEPAGIDVELLEMLAQRMGLTVEYVHYPFKRGLKMMESGEIDLMTSILRRPEREMYLHFIEPPYKNETCKAFYVLKGREHVISSHADLRGLRVGTILGVGYYPEFDGDPGIDRYPVASIELNIRMLLAGRIDAFISTESSGDYRIAAAGLGDKVSKVVHVYREPQNVHMALSRRSPHAARLDEFNRTMADLVAEGAVDRARERLFREGIR